MKPFHYSTAPLSVSVSQHYCVQNVVLTLCNCHTNATSRPCYSANVTNDNIGRLRTQRSSNKPKHKYFIWSGEVSDKCYETLLLNLKKDEVNKLFKLEFHILFIVLTSLYLILGHENITNTLTPVSGISSVRC